jgi:hypothetical protein
MVRLRTEASKGGAPKQKGDRSADRSPEVGFAVDKDPITHWRRNDNLYGRRERYSFFFASFAASELLQLPSVAPL